MASVTRAPLTLAPVGQRCGAGPGFEGAVKSRQAFKANLHGDVLHRLLALQQQATRDVQAQLMLDLKKGRAFCLQPPDQRACGQVQRLSDGRHVAVFMQPLLQASADLTMQRCQRLQFLVGYIQLAGALCQQALQRLELPPDLPDDDRQYCIDLGLIARRDRQLQIANRLYREVLPRELTSIVQDSLQGLAEQPWFVLPDGSIAIDKLLGSFQQFFRENSQSWLQRYAYHEAGPQLLLQAFLQRVVNGGGRIAREYGLGRGRTDLFLQWPLSAQGYLGAMQQVVLELKIQHKGKAATLATGLAQTARYADQCSAYSAHLLIFDRDPSVPWDTKIYREAHTQGSRSISVWGM